MPRVGELLGRPNGRLVLVPFALAHTPARIRSEIRMRSRLAMAYPAGDGKPT